MQKETLIIKNVLIEKGVPDMQGNTLNLTEVKMKHVPGMEGFVIVNHNYKPDEPLGAAQIFLQGSPPVLRAHFKLEYDDSYKGMKLYPCIAYTFELEDVDQEKHTVTKAVITSIGLCDNPNADMDIEPINL